MTERVCEMIEKQINHILNDVNSKKPSLFQKKEHENEDHSKQQENMRQQPDQVQIIHPDQISSAAASTMLNTPLHSNLKSLKSASIHKLTQEIVSNYNTGVINDYIELITEEIQSLRSLMEVIKFRNLRGRSSVDGVETLGYGTEPATSGLYPRSFKKSKKDRSDFVRTNTSRAGITQLSSHPLAVSDCANNHGRSSNNGRAGEFKRPKSISIDQYIEMQNTSLNYRLSDVRKRINELSSVLRKARKRVQLIERKSSTKVLFSSKSLQYSSFIKVIDRLIHYP